MEQKQTEPTKMSTYDTLYPDLYYRIQPFILAASDEINQVGYGVPTKEAVHAMSDQVYKDVCRLYPEMAQSSGVPKKGQEMPEAQQFFQSRGLLRDILDIWLLNEIFNRRRY